MNVLSIKERKDSSSSTLENFSGKGRDSDAVSLGDSGNSARQLLSEY